MVSTDARIYQGEALDVLYSLETGSFGGCVTDPPYSSGGAFRGDRVGTRTATEKYISTEHRARYTVDFEGDSRDQRGWFRWCVLWLEEVRRIVEVGGVLACFTDWRQLPTLTDAVQSAGWIWRGIVPWDKTEATRQIKGRFRSQAEFVVWASNGPLDLDREAPVLPGVIRCPVPKNKRHPTEKPVDMLRQVCRIVAAGRPILDPFLGSGAHGVAALLEGHPFVGVERTPHYAAEAAARIRAELASAGLTAAQVEAVEARGERPAATQITLFGAE